MALPAYFMMRVSLDNKLDLHLLIIGLRQTMADSNIQDGGDTWRV